MKNRTLLLLALGLGTLFSAGTTLADNPLIRDQFTADPTARVFDGKIYLYPSHDIVPPAGRARGFCMEDYHAFSSENLMDWEDHGVIVAQTKVPWVNPVYRMWAPDCVTKNGKYYFYFPAPPKAVEGGRRGGWGIGVAIAEKPGGPFKPEEKPIEGANGIDPCVLIDKDGQGYLFFSLNAIFVAKLKENMIELDSKPQFIPNLPTKGLVEGPFAFERNGKYYLTFPHAIKTERLEYAMADNPMGPYKMAGVIMDESPSGCWTNHHSIVEYKGQWYLFYHDMDLSSVDTNRSAHADYLTFNADGTINKVIPTLRGVGIADATHKIQIDRYSAISKQGAKVSFVDDTQKSQGWKIALTEKEAFVQYDHVDFGKAVLKAASVRALSSTGGVVEIHLDKPDGPLVAKVAIPKGSDWTVVNGPLSVTPSDVHNLVVTMPESDDAEIDWVTFE